jgi:hypothetical protein
VRVGTDTTTERLSTRVDIALQGVRMDAPVSRPEGAGPSDDGHVLIDGANAALPRNPGSPYRLHDGRIFLGKRDTGLSLQLVTRPRFYDLVTADGVRYEQIARLHGPDVLATTVVQTCIRYTRTNAAGSAPSRSRCDPAPPPPPRLRLSWPRWRRRRSRWTGSSRW